MTTVSLSHLASLSNITLSKEQEDQLAKQFEETLAYVENLQELDTEQVAPTSSVSGARNVYFDDVVDEGRKIAPGTYKVDRIL